MQVQTINLKGNEYATVPQRLKQFREDNPRSVVETKPDIQENGTIIFSAHILKDKADENTAEATGHSYGQNGESKAFEKLETVAVGRALALLGYLNNGQIATSEEMVEFEEYKLERLEEAIGNASERKEFVEIMNGLTPELKKFATPLINKRIEELKDNGNTSTGGTA